MTEPSEDMPAEVTITGSSELSLWTLNEVIVSDPDLCAPMITKILAQLDRFEWLNRDVFAIHMSLEEGILNAIRHGNQCCHEKKVQVQVQVDANRFYAKITDQGEGFRLDDVPDPTLEENLDRASGRGVMLIRVFMDRVVYNEVGNSVEFFKSKSVGRLETDG